MSVHSLSSKRAADPVREAKIHLAAAHRLAVLHELEEGIDNHFTVTLPAHLQAGARLPHAGARDELREAAGSAVRCDRQAGAGAGAGRPAFAQRARPAVLRSHDARARPRAAGLRRLSFAVREYLRR